MQSLWGMQTFRRRLSSNTTKVLRKSYDIVIAGGGLVGSCAACAIASDPLLQSLRVLVIEPREPKIWKASPERFSNRVYSVAPGTRKLLEELSAWKTVEALRYRPVRRLQVWESASEAAISFQQPRLDEYVSYVVEDEVLASAVWTRLGELSSQVDVVHNLSAKTYDLPSRRNDMHKKEAGSASRDDSGREDRVKIVLSDGTQLETSLLIGADGPSSAVRQAMGVQYLNWSYDQKGIVASLQLSEAQDNSVAWQRFTSLGPIALLPLDEKRSSLVWSTNTEDATRLLALSDEEFLDALNQALWEEQDKKQLAGRALEYLDRFIGKFGQRPANFQQIPPTLTAVDKGSRAAFPLALGHATRYVVPHVALIGDAAHRIHPLAGLGVNLGFEDVTALRAALRKTVACGAELGSLPHLLQYETQAQRTVVPVMAAVDSLHRLYSTQWTPAVVLRSLGLNLVNACEPLKGRIMQHASL
ncbi:Ubiquinone biosynthesis monooxygenase COQ6, mitochondrial [Hypsibius exemplaris]|uniref:Ubiquinone biosynthesis monooxygenase COQ6, mitochondrial n=1 Tax=Hypsibius exemplaris TaxID=2072580 RepID=A0A1W0WYA5_HYPEX|nr:Ubiquinone biosynthesis monooxygenase COQ6, mitochondrial [Hypsibius exemplaris]